MILYGWNNYLLKSIQPHELGILKPQDPEVKIEYRQKYFHLFFIPVFPLGRFWAVRQQGKMYEPSPDLRAALQSLDVSTKKVLWAWTGIWLAIGAFFVFKAGESIEASQRKQYREANASVLNSYFQNTANTEPLSKKLRTINFIIDSTINDEAYESKKIDTTDSGIIDLYISILGTQKDSLTGYNENNTAVFTCINHVKRKEGLPGDDIRKALDNGQWNGYADSNSVFKSLRQLQQYKYLLVLKEYNRVEPGIRQNGFTSGISLANGYIFNLENKRIEYQFKVLGGNSDSVSHSTFRRKGESNQVSSSEWRSVLTNDLNRNVIRKGTKYVFRKEDIAKTF